MAIERDVRGFDKGRSCAMRGRWCCAAGFLGALAVAAAWCALAQDGKLSDKPPGKPPAKKTALGIVVSRETTFITGPLREDGTVDYVAALNQRCSQGVTPENNAVVLLLQAVGPAEIDSKVRERFFKMLGIAPLPEKGAYLEPFTEYFDRKSPPAAARKEKPDADLSPEEKAAIEAVTRELSKLSKPGQKPYPSEEAQKQRDRITDRPWSKADSPIAANWLKENDKQIGLVIAAAMRPRFYAPLVTAGEEPGNVIEAIQPLGILSRDAARALCARAMFRIAAGKSEGAWQDLLACHRLGRLVSQAPMLVDRLIALAIEWMAVHGDAVLAHEGKLTAEQARRFAAEFRRLPPMPKLADTINWGERFMFLDGVSMIAREMETKASRPDGKPGAGKAGFAGKAFSDWLSKWRTNSGIDWNEAMRFGNPWYDRIAAAFSKPTHKERAAAGAEFAKELNDTVAAMKDRTTFLFRLILTTGSTRTAVGRVIGIIYLALALPAASAFMDVEERNAVYQDMLPVVFALAAYRADHGVYPADLTALVPKYLPAIPEDLFSGKPLCYKRQQSGYVLYSVGKNGKDDGGRSNRDEPDAMDIIDCDDIAIRVPVSEKSGN
jgi:hypothetical protein